MIERTDASDRGCAEGGAHARAGACPFLDCLAALEDAELRVFAAAVGEHLPIELIERASALRAERELYAALASASRG